ncbi:MAG: type VI secretion system contractile sheath domain-containing protein [Maricaulaceae bacterium]
MTWLNAQTDQNAAERVSIRFGEGDPLAGRSLPFVIGVIGGFFGDRAYPALDTVEPITLADDAIDRALAAWRPQFRLARGGEALEWTFTRLTDFDTAKLSDPAHTPYLAQLQALREGFAALMNPAAGQPTPSAAHDRFAASCGLADPADFSSVDGLNQAAEALRQCLIEPPPERRRFSRGDATATLLAAWFALGAPQPVKTATETPLSLAAKMLAEAHIDVAEARWDLVLAAIDAHVAEIIEAVRAEPRFIRLEAHWRAAAHLARYCASGEVRLRLTPAAPDKLFDDLLSAEDTESTVFHRLLVGQSYNQLGETPYALVLWFYGVKGGPQAAPALRRLADIGAQAHCPIVLDADPDLFGEADYAALCDWTYDLLDHEDFVREKLPDWWSALREDVNTRYLALAMPPLHLPRDDAAAFAGASVGAGALAPAATALGALTAQAFLRYGWAVAITGLESGAGVLADWPRPPVSYDPDPSAAPCPLTVQITDLAEDQLRNAGLCVFVSHPIERSPGLAAAPSVHRPANPPAVGGRDRAGDRHKAAVMSAALPYTFAATRFAHFLKVSLRERIGSQIDASDLALDCNSWVTQYVLLRSDAPEPVRAQRPLRHARIVIEPVDGSPGAYTAAFELRPHYQLTALDYDITLATGVAARAQG